MGVVHDPQTRFIEAVISADARQKRRPNAEDLRTRRFPPARESMASTEAGGGEGESSLSEAYRLSFPLHCFRLPVE